MTTTAPDLLRQVKQEYLEMPGLVLTPRQASRLWNVEIAQCRELLAALVHEQFLHETRGGAFLRRVSPA